MKKIFYILASVATLVIWLSCEKQDQEDLQERTKIALREVGNQLLIKQQDSLSLIPPIKSIDHSRFQLSFESEIHFEPEDLVVLMQDNIVNTLLPKHYRVEVIQCKDYEVAYSYQMSDDEERTIVPCEGRKLPKACYYIELKFLNKTSSKRNSQIILYVLGGMTVSFLLFGIFWHKRPSNDNKDGGFVLVGNFKFYEAESKLTNQDREIALSKKECELLAIFVARPNETISREELTKRVWEDNGVIVGRSLDTFISKLRKKLKEDDAIKLSNVHGIGYKLELL